jgi:hypothetical protein
MDRASLPTDARSYDRAGHRRDRRFPCPSRCYRASSRPADRLRARPSIRTIRGPQPPCAALRTPLAGRSGATLQSAHDGCEANGSAGGQGRHRGNVPKTSYVLTRPVELDRRRAERGPGCSANVATGIAAAEPTGCFATRPRWLGPILRRTAAREGSLIWCRAVHSRGHRNGGPDEEDVAVR